MLKRLLILGCLIALFCGLLADLTLWLLQRASAPFDVVLMAGQIVDGRGGPPYVADLGIRGGRIRGIGNLRWARATRRINVRGLTVAPGFIDVHAHVEASLPHAAGARMRAPNFVLQGVTTLITGNCGTSETQIGQMLDRQRGWQLNVATLVGHNSVRQQVMGLASRAPSREEMAKMVALVTSAMRQGALGLSTGLAYVPGTYAQRDELVELARVAAAYGGLYVSHIRDEAAGGETAIREALEIGRLANLPVHISHFKVAGKGQWNHARDRLALVQQAIRRGTQVTIDQYPYAYSSSTIDLLVPTDMFQSHSSSISASANQRMVEGVLRQAVTNGWDNLNFARVAWYGPDHAIEGMLIEEVCRHYQKPCPSMRGQAEMIVHLHSTGGAQMLFHDMTEEDVRAVVEFQDTMVGTDSRIRYGEESNRPHPRGFGTFPRLLAVYVRPGVISLADAVRRMSGLPAQVFGLSDRGQIRLGKWADLVVFDFQTVEDRATLENPLARPSGIEYVFVNGVLVVQNGEETDAFPGMALRRERWASIPSLAYTLRDAPAASAADSETVAPDPLSEEQQYSRNKIPSKAATAAKRNVLNVAPPKTSTAPKSTLRIAPKPAVSAPKQKHTDHSNAKSRPSAERYRGIQSRAKRTRPTRTKTL